VLTSCVPAAGKVQAMWIGHASLLVQMHGVSFLTDPVLSERCSFSQVCPGKCQAGRPEEG
jgi:L-ascorbate metabolism protein UlaG (beta-lactamase superfamily)